MLTLAAAGAAIAGAVSMLPAAPAQAQTQDRVITIYGNDKCPSDQGQGIVVCRRMPETERYRIPKDLRDAAPPPQAVGSNAAAAVNTTGGSGVQIKSCNAIGAGVNDGCMVSELNNWKAQQRAAKKAEAAVP
jgi:hypothetical protein